MANEVETMLVLDDRLDVSDKIPYGVYKGGASVNSGIFPATAQSSSSHTYNIQVPSKRTIVDRRVLWQSTVTLTVSAVGSTAQAVPGSIDTGYTSGGSLVVPALYDSLGPFPLHNMCNTISATINNNTVSMSTQDVLPQLLRLNNKGDLLAYNGTTPTSFDTFNSYNDTALFNSSPLSGIDNSPDEDINERGAFPVVVAGAGIANPVVNGTTYSNTITFSVSEPLLLSPFMFGQPQNKAGFYNIQNMSFQMNIGNLQRAWRHALQKSSPPVIASDRSWNINVSNVQFTNSQLVFTFISPHDDMKLPDRCVSPYYELPRYILTPTNQTPLGSGASTSIASNALQLGNIPDKLVICVRKPMSAQVCQDTDSWFVINSISLQFNNVAGLCSGWTQQQLWQSSREAGSNQSWLEFSGLAQSAKSGAVKMSGSLLVLEVGKDLALREAFLAAGVGGSYNLQFTINVTNPYGVAVAPELVLMTMNSGVFVTDDGKSTIKLDCLSTKDVVDARNSGHGISHSAMKRIVGSGFLDSIKSAWKSASPFVKKGVVVADALSGSGHSGGGLSGGAAASYAGKEERAHKSLKDRLKA